MTLVRTTLEGGSSLSSVLLLLVDGEGDVGVSVGVLEAGWGSASMSVSGGDWLDSVSAAPWMNSQVAVVSGVSAPLWWSLSDGASGVADPSLLLAQTESVGVLTSSSEADEFLVGLSVVGGGGSVASSGLSLDLFEGHMSEYVALTSLFSLLDVDHTSLDYCGWSEVECDAVGHVLLM